MGGDAAPHEVRAGARRTRGRGRSARGCRPARDPGREPRCAASPVLVHGEAVLESEPDVRGERPRELRLVRAAIRPSPHRRRGARLVRRRRARDHALRLAGIRIHRAWPPSVSTPLVSVFTPTYNAEAFVAETIESVLAQTHANVEHVLVDD